MYEEDMKDVRLGDERERHWRMVFEENMVGVDDEKAIIYAKMWYVYMNYKQ